MTEKQQINIKCPFFVDSRKTTIECESFIGSAAMLTRFPDVPAMLEHVERYCVKEDGGKCPLALNLYDKYVRLERLEQEREKQRKLMYLKRYNDSPSGAADGAKGGAENRKTLSESGSVPAQTPSHNRQWRF